MKKYVFLTIAIVGFAILTRLLPHPPNFAPIMAVAIVTGLYFPRRYAYIVPLIALAVSDLIIGGYHLLIMVSVYGSVLLAVSLATYVRRHRRIHTILGAILGSALLFFLITNMAVWAFGTMYPHTLAGLGMSYYMALPFFRNSLLGDLFYTGALIGIIEGARAMYHQYVFMTADKQI